MRSSSIKTLVVALSVTVVLVAAAPRAEAKSSRPSRSHIGAIERFQKAVNQYMKRAFSVLSDALPTDPVPVSFYGENEETMTTTTTNSPKKQR